jgi:hypothetical protein
VYGIGEPCWLTFAALRIASLSAIQLFLATVRSKSKFEGHLSHVGAGQSSEFSSRQPCRCQSTIQKSLRLLLVVSSEKRCAAIGAIFPLPTVRQINATLL